MPVVAARPLAAARRYVGRWGLIVALAALPVYYTVRDLTHGYEAGFVHGHALIHHDLTNVGNNITVSGASGSMSSVVKLLPTTGLMPNVGRKF